jgi:LmbE family N-acetylglucosaminyl deacetylase
MKQTLSISFWVLCFLLVSLTLYFLSIGYRVKNPGVPVVDHPKSYLEQPRVAVICAHDDDYLSATATLLQLVEAGFAVDYLCLTLHNHHGQAERRRQEIQTAMELLGAHTVRIHPLELHDGSVSYRAIPKATFDDHYDLDTLHRMIRDFLYEVQASAVFSLDHEIGAYGHPDHVVVGQAVKEICEKEYGKPGFTVKSIWQMVYPDPLEECVMEEIPTYEEALQVYQQPEGMPDPNLAVAVGGYGAEKLAILQTHASQHNSLKKFFPGYRSFPGWLYNWIFDTEYFRIIALDSLEKPLDLRE